MLSPFQMLTGNLDIFLNIRNVFNSDLMLSSSSVTCDLRICVCGFTFHNGLCVPASLRVWASCRMPAVVIIILLGTGCS